MTDQTPQTDQLAAALQAMTELAKNLTANNAMSRIERIKKRKAEIFATMDGEKEIQVVATQPGTFDPLEGIAPLNTPRTIKLRAFSANWMKPYQQKDANVLKTWRKGMKEYEDFLSTA